MSNLRRRVLEDKERLIVYLDTGWLPTDGSVTAFTEELEINSDYPQAFASTAFRVSTGDTVNVIYTGTTRAPRIRKYSLSGTSMMESSTGTGKDYIDDNSEYCISWDNVPVYADLYVRLLDCYGTSTITSINITHSDGTATTYTVVDRR